ncbi:hypothetical protein B0T20DRAFT_377947 [Sordaria brevicollis]|uniref:BTB domain-containing protein n=1 Tax=Sordaria brevicollis TaxID=83679 RepID=A0AAE0UBY8_SORBR|nr:hypothetical protein B0T20DRAFT_377947 [Sordaria brevicollis]
MVLRKDQLELKLKDDEQLIRQGVLRNEHPFDDSTEFHEFIQACRRGDLKHCQELISGGVNINGKDKYDYTPLIIASLCGHYELVQLLLESGALADPDSFERERAVYNALNNKIRNLLLSYDYTKTADPLQAWSSHITSLLVRETPKTTDITLVTPSEEFKLHKFILSSRSPYFRRKFAETPDISHWKLSSSVPVEAFRVVIRYLYLGELPRDLVGPRSTASEEEVFKGIDKLCKHLEIAHLWEAVLSATDRRLARQRHQDEVGRARSQIATYFQETVLKHKFTVDTRRVGDVKWPRGNAISANCLLRADQFDEAEGGDGVEPAEESLISANGIPIGPTTASNSTNGSSNGTKKPRRSVLYPVHKAFLIRSPYFETMFSSEFMEAKETEHLHVIKMDCTPEVLEIILTFLYTEKSDCPLDLGLELLYASDMLLLDKLKTKAAVAISTLGSGTSNALVDRTHGAAAEELQQLQSATSASTPSDGRQQTPTGLLTGSDGQPVEVEPINVYDVIHAAWDLKVQRLEDFAARYLASRLEDYIDEEEFAELIQESASRLKRREETDTIELLDDIRYYLGERFRFRFEGDGIEEMLNEDGEIDAEQVEGLATEAGNGEAQAEQPSDGQMEGQEREKEGSVERDGANGEGGGVRTLDGNLVEDEFVSDAVNYQILLEKIDKMLDRLNLAA